MGDNFVSHKQPGGKHNNVKNLDKCRSLFRKRRIDCSVHIHRSCNQHKQNNHKYKHGNSHNRSKRHRKLRTKTDQHCQNHINEHGYHNFSKVNIISGNLIMESPLQSISKHISGNHGKCRGICPKKRNVSQFYCPCSQKSMIVSKYGLGIDV